MHSDPSKVIPARDDTIDFHGRATTDANQEPSAAQKPEAVAAVPQELHDRLVAAVAGSDRKEVVDILRAVTDHQDIILSTVPDIIMEVVARAAEEKHQLDHCHFLQAEQETYRKRLEQDVAQNTAEIVKREERFNRAMDASLDGLFDWDLVTNAIYYSPGWKRMLGYEVDELPDDFSVWETLTHPEDVERCWAMQQELINRERDRFKTEFRMKHKDGYWVDILSRAEATFDKDGTAVRIVGTHTDISARKRVERELRGRVYLESLVSEISSHVAGVSSQDIDAEINTALARIGAHVGADRSYVFIIEADGRAIGNTHEWCAEGIEPQIAHLQNVPAREALPYFMQAMDRLEVFDVPDVAALPAEAAHDRAHFQSQSIQSLLVVPMSISGRLCGFLGFDAVRERVAWTQAEIAVLKFVGDAIHGALMRARQENALHYSEEKFRALWEHSRDGLFIHDLDGVLVEANQALFDMMGYARDEAIGMSVDQFHARDGVATRDRSLEQLRQTGSGEFEATFRRRSGEEFIGLVRVNVVSLGGQQFVQGSVRDVTATRRVHGELMAERDRAQSYLDIAGVMLIAIDDRQSVTMINRRGCEILGAERDEVLGKNWFDTFLPPEQIDEVKAVYDHIIAGDIAPVEYYENPIVRPDGERRDILWHNAILHDPDGTIIGLLSSGDDITERKHTEDLLSRAQALGHIGTWDLDIVNDVLAWTDENYKIFRVPVGTPLTYEIFLECVHPGDRDYVNEQWTRFMQTNEYDIEHRLLVNGVVRWVREKADVTFDSEGQPIHAIGVTQDITEQKQTEAQLRQSQKMESIGTLAGGVAHDFNNLLMGIMNYAELCRDGIDPDHPIREWIDEITCEAERSAEIVRQLLAFSRKQVIAPRVLSLNDTVEGMLKMLRRLIGEDIKIMWKPSAELGTVKVDPGQVDQILANLCVNARDAIGGVGKITIETANVTLDADYCAGHAEVTPGAYVMLAVSDDGCGMDEATRNGIFEPFFSTKPEHEGTGLGLATVYGIVKQNDGLINVYSEPGRGTTFHIYLPRCAEAVEKEKQSGAPDVAVQGGETILLVEDEKSIRVTAHLFLEAAGYTVLAAESPAAALRCVEERGAPPDLLVTDVVMPGMTGRELADQLRKVHRGLKVLYMSGYTATVIAVRGILEDDVDFMPKPITRDLLLRTVREVLDA